MVKAQKKAMIAQPASTMMKVTTKLVTTKLVTTKAARISSAVVQAMLASMEIKPTWSTASKAQAAIRFIT